MDKNSYNEYYLLTEKLEEIVFALEGKCNDIDCDKYMYKQMLKQKYKPILEHNFSCIKSLKRDKAAIMRLLSQSQFKRYRYVKCYICQRIMDKLSKNNTIVCFTRISAVNKKLHELNMVRVHNNCKRKVKIPKGWNQF